MAESSSNSSTASTGAGSTSTSTSTSNSGASAPGSQTSSNGSSSTGKGSGNSGNNGVGPGLSFGAGLASNTGSGWTSNSNGNFGGGGPNGTTTGFTGLASDNFGQGWGGSYSISPDSEGKHTIKPNAEGKHVITQKYSKPQSQALYMTVDEVYGKGNQSIVESQGDYEASSNEKSNVETSTFGKQDEISVTPVSVTKDKGLVNNDAIQSVEGLGFQQKDKANQEVMEAKKSRDEAESEDKSDSMRNQLKAVAEKDAEEDNNTFQVGEKNTFEEQDKAKLDQLNQKNQELENAKNAVNQKQEAINKAKEAQAKTKETLDFAKRVGDRKEAEVDALVNYFDRTVEGGILTKINNVLDPGALKSDKEKATKLAETYNLNETKEAITNAKDSKQLLAIAKDLQNQIKTKNAEILNQTQEKYNKQAEEIQALEDDYNNAVNKQAELQAAYEAANQEYTTWKTEYWAADAKTKAEETVTAETPSYKGIIDTAKNEINNSKDLTDEQKAEANTVLGNVESAAEAAEKAASDLAANPNDADIITTYHEANETLIGALKDAKGNNVLKNTNFNRTFAESVVAAINKSTVTMPDGSTKSIAEFMTETVTRSPELAKGLYEAKAKYYADKAKELEDNGEKGIRSAAYRALAAIKTKQSEMAMTWLGSKFTFADNQVRNQFIQLAKTNDRATYAAYNNVLKDKTGKYSEADKAEASAAINQSNAMMTASTALQASTGFFSGIGDGTSDGVYGVTDPGSLNGYQEALNAASNVAKIVLGLGVTPGANKAYQNMYYLAGAKVNESGLYSRDFDGDGFALCQEYGNNAAAGMIAAVCELGTGVALVFNPATSKLGINLAIDSVQTFFDALYGVQKEVNKSIKLSNEILNYFGEAKSIAAETGNKEAISTMDSAIKKIEDFQLKSDEVGNLDNWLEGSGSNTADNGKFNQALSYDEWLKLIEADPVMQEYARSLNR